MHRRGRTPSPLSRPAADRAGRARAIVGAAVGCALLVAATGFGGPSGSSVSMANETPAPARGSLSGSTYAVLQMNLCLSGFAGCYGKVAYPAGVRDAVARIRETRPDAVTLNEACRGDVAAIARRTGYHLRFSTVTFSGDALPCVRPRGRGVFGDAVLTKAAVESSDSHDFAAQAGTESRRWLCVATRAGVDVCTAHLTTRPTGNDAQCTELAAVLERRAAAGTVVFGGDVNRRRPCAPAHAWTRADTSAGQALGLQSVSGDGALRSPSAEVLPAAHTDHDGLLVRARLTRG